MAHIEHVALWVSDIDRVAAFYQAYLGAGVGARYENPAKGFASRFLALAGGARIELMSSRALAADPGRRSAPRPGWAHVAIALDSEAAVDALAARLRADGHDVVDGPRHTGDGYDEVVVLDPEGNRVELTV